MEVINLNFLSLKCFEEKKTGNCLISFLYRLLNFLIVGSHPNNLNLLLKKDKKVPSLLPISRIKSLDFKLYFFF